MNWFLETIFTLWKNCNRKQRGSKQRRQRKSQVYLELWTLEERVVPSASTLGTLSGRVFVASNVQQIIAPGVEVTLTGTNGNFTTTTDANGAFAFRSVPAGTYQLSGVPGAAFITGGTVSGLFVFAGQNTSANVAIGGLAPGFVSLRDFLSSTTAAEFPFSPAGATANRAPFVNNAIANVTLASSSTQTIDLAANFADPDMTNSVVTFDTSDGAMSVILDDAQAPQTVANLFDYILTNRYDNTIFHRLDTSPPVLQGGGFLLQPDATNGFTFPSVASPTEPTVQNEFSFSRPNILGTLAMAKPGGNPNGATSEFFFNLADNTTTLGPSNNGGFTVFGAVASDATSQAVFAKLQATPVKNESQTNSVFNVLPLNNYSGTNFPKDTTTSNYLVINDVKVVKRDEALTYTVVSNSNPSVVSAQFASNHPEVLSLVPAGASSSGTATITVMATDLFGATATTSFTVTVVPLAISSVTNPINKTNAPATAVSGTATAGASVSVTATDGTTTTTAVQATTANNGTWTATVNAANLVDGTITYTATTTNAGNTVSTTKTATKDTVAPAVAISSVTDPINSGNQASTTASGTAEAGASISVVASDGTKTTPAALVTAGSNGTWTVNLDVSSLASGTITYTATATDAEGNTASNSKTATKA